MAESNITALLAIYGAVVSTLALFWNIVRDIWDRRIHADVSVALAKIHDTDDTSHPLPGEVWVSILNSSRRTIRLAGIDGIKERSTSGLGSRIGGATDCTVQPGG